MTPSQALSMLDQAVGLLQLNRADHTKLLEAVQTLGKIVPADEAEAAKPAPITPEVVK